jgi:hypothetical protein
MIITLPDDITEALKKEAAHRGTTPEQLALESLRDRFVPPAPPQLPREGETLADFLEGYIGTFNSSEIIPGGAQLSVNSSEKFAALLAAKHRRKAR